MGGDAPELLFEEKKVISKELGLVTLSEVAYSFSLNKGFAGLNQQAEGQEEIGEIELIGDMAADLTATLELETILFEDHFLDHIPHFTQLVDLNTNSGSFWVHPEEETQENLEFSPLSQAAIYESNY